MTARLLLLLALLLPRPAAGGEVRVADTEGLRRALAALKPGTTVLLAPGTYGGGHHVSGVAGGRTRPW